ncbi:MAG TPA: UDP-N-acetylmuramoyl-tripeptide--D-alanyl-D-alanine ligase [Euzebyales bacterium]|nr:UDP-N-acetylmuramoyl-tripeptide--D-alanyl-D-alanine ligase [Euzebyales bacterium]
MIELTLEQLANVVGGDLLDGSAAAAVVHGVTIDSRTVAPGDLFVALVGTRTDGHRYVGQALAAGAAGALVAADRVDHVVPDAAAVVVDHPGDALLALGAWVRETADPTVIAVTGSNGKTTTKDLIAAALRDRAVVANEGSFNNELGVPLTCCRVTRDTEVLVSELGMRGVGQIAELAALLRPSIGIVTSVAAVHLELLGSIEAIAAAKGELVEALDPEGVAVLAADDPLVAAMADRTTARVVTFGRSADADFRATGIELDEAARARFVLDSPHGRHDVAVPVAGVHNVGNALAALAAATAAGVPLPAAIAGLGGATVSRWRLQLETVDGIRVFNDAYNANPTSVAAALRTLCAVPTPGRRWAVLGTMAEIGATSAEEHHRTGRVVADLGVDALVTVGLTAAGIAEGANANDPARCGQRWAVDDVETAAGLLADRVAAGDVVLVKASRSAGLERVVARLAELRTAGAATGERCW